MDNPITAKSLKDQLYHQGVNIVIHGPTGTGKTDLLNALIPPNRILHSEMDVSRKYSGFKYDFPHILPDDVVGIDEAHHLNSRSVTKCIQIIRTRGIGFVLVCQDLNSDPMPELRPHLINAVLIDSKSTDLREFDPNHAAVSHTFSVAKTIDGMS